MLRASAAPGTRAGHHRIGSLPSAPGDKAGRRARFTPDGDACSNAVLPRPEAFTLWLSALSATGHMIILDRPCHSYGSGRGCSAIPALGAGHPVRFLLPGAPQRQAIGGSREPWPNSNRSCAPGGCRTNAGALGGTASIFPWSSRAGPGRRSLCQKAAAASLALRE